MTTKPGNPIIIVSIFYLEFLTPTEKGMDSLNKYHAGKQQKAELL